MKKASSKIREEIARLQEALKAAETREAERIGRIALKAGLGDIDIDENELQVALEAVAGRFQGDATGPKGKGGGVENGAEGGHASAITPVKIPRGFGEA